MAMLSKLKKLLGLGGSSRSDAGTSVPVEREPEAETERAVKTSSPFEATEPDDTGRGVESVDDLSTDDEPIEAAEPAVEPDDDTSPAAGSTDDVQSLDGIGPAYADKLGEAGVHTVGDLAGADAEALAEETGLGAGRIASWIERANAR